MIALVPGERDGHQAARSLFIGHELGRFGCSVPPNRHLDSVIVARPAMLRSLHDFLGPPARADALGTLCCSRQPERTFQP